MYQFIKFQHLITHYAEQSISQKFQLFAEPTKMPKTLNQSHVAW